MISKRQPKQKQKMKPLLMPKLTMHDNNLILLKKNDECTKEDDLLGPLGKTLREEANRKKILFENFQKEVDQIKEKNRRALVSQKTVLNKIDYNYLDILEKREQDLKGFEKSKELHCEQSKRPVYVRRRTLRDLEQHKTLRFFPVVSKDWMVRVHILNRFVEAARRVLIHRRLLARLDALKSLTDEDLRLAESGECIKRVTHGT